MRRVLRIGNVLFWTAIWAALNMQSLHRDAVGLVFFGELTAHTIVAVLLWRWFDRMMRPELKA